MSEKLHLGENHRRVVSVILRGIEQMCDEIEARIGETPGLLRHTKNDLSAVQCQALRDMTGRLRGDIHRLNAEVELDKFVASRRRAIFALLSANIVNLEETDPKNLRGYGEMSKDTEEYLAAEFERLINALEAMVEVITD